MNLSTLLILLMILNALDYVTTIYGVSSGLFEEANPYSKALLERGNFEEVKVSISVSLGLLALLALEVEQRGLFLRGLGLCFVWYLASVFVLLVVFLYVFVVANNLLLLSSTFYSKADIVIFK